MWAWLPMNKDKVNMNELLIQIETRAREMSRTRTSESSIMKSEVKVVINDIARGLIKERLTSMTESNRLNENHNANAAKADIKG